MPMLPILFSTEAEVLNRAHATTQMLEEPLIDTRARTLLTFINEGRYKGQLRFVDFRHSVPHKHIFKDEVALEVHLVLQSEDISTLEIEDQRTGKTIYKHYFDGDIETFDSEFDLNRVLSQECNGFWEVQYQEKGTSSSEYVLDTSGWVQREYTVFSEEERELAFHAYRDKQEVKELWQSLFLGTVALSLFGRYLPSMMGSVNELFAERNSASTDNGDSLFRMPSIPSTLLWAPMMNMLIKPSSTMENLAYIGWATFLLNRAPVSEAVLVLVPTTSPFFVDNGTWTRESPSSSVAALSNGGFVVTWGGAAGLGGSFPGYVYARLFDATSQAIGSAFRIDNTTAGNSPAVSSAASLVNQNFIVTWADSTDGILSALFNSAGQVLNSNFRMNIVNINYNGASVAGLANGNFIATWSTSSSIYGQLFSPTAQPLGSNFQIGTGAGGIPSVAGLTNGNLAVTWGTSARLLNATGAPIGAQFTVGSSSNPAVAALANGGFVVAYQTPGTSNTHSYGQCFDATAAAVGANFPLHADAITCCGETSPKLASLSDGGFVAAWVVSTNGGSVYMQRFNVTCGRVGNPLQVSDYGFNSDSSINSPSLIELTNGNVAVKWQSILSTTGQNTRFYGRLYNNINNPVVVIPYNTTITYYTYNLGSGINIDSSNIGMTIQADSANLASGTIAITSGFVPSEDSLCALNSAGCSSSFSFSQSDGTALTGNYNPTTGVMTFSGTTSVANYQEFLKWAPAYRNTATNPTRAPRTIAVTLSDGAHTSNTATYTLNILSGLGLAAGGNAISGCVENSNTPVTIDGGIVIKGDVDGTATISNACVSFSNALTNFGDGTESISLGGVCGQSGQCQLPNGINVQGEGGAYAIKLAGVSTVANYQSLLRNLTFQTKSTQYDNIRRIRISINLVDLNSCFYTGNYGLGYQFNVCPPSPPPPPSTTIISDSLSSSTNIKNTIIGSTVSGALGIGFFALRLFMQKRAAKQLDALTESGSETAKQQAALRKEIIRPLLKRLFESLKTTGLMGGRDAAETQAYVDMMERILSRLLNLGANLDFTKMTALEKTHLMSEIVKQVRLQAAQSLNCCSKFFKPEITPKDIEVKEKEIAKAVFEALREDNHVAVKSVPMAMEGTSVIPQTVIELPRTQYMVAPAQNLQRAGMYSAPGQPVVIHLAPAPVMSAPMLVPTATTPVPAQNDAAAMRLQMEAMQRQMQQMQQMLLAQQPSSSSLLPGAVRSP